MEHTKMMEESRELICIRCPMGCRMTIGYSKNRELRIRGNTCPKGAEYASRELTAPSRVITSAIPVRGGCAARVPVKTKGEIPKKKIMECMEEIHRLTVQAPIEIGDVICDDIAQTGISLVATKSVAVLR